MLSSLVSSNKKQGNIHYWASNCCRSITINVFIIVILYFADDTDELLRMLEQLAVSERRGLVQGWDSAGSVFLDFLRIRNQFQQLSLSKDTPSQYQLESLHMGVKQLAPRISQLPSDSPRKVLVFIIECFL